MSVKVKSVVYKHLVSVLNAEIQRYGDKEAIRILDVGCGDGYLVSCLTENLAVARNQRIEVYGLDVNDHGVQQAGFIARTIDVLSACCPSVAWQERIASVSVHDPWPYDEGSFDIIVSNQVLEHVGDLDRFFSEVSRTLEKGGFSVHLFPLSCCFMESHLNLPLAHRIVNHTLLAWYIRVLSRLGLGKFKTHGGRLDSYADMHADYMLNYTNYFSYRSLFDVVKKHGLRASLKHTPMLYLNKIRSLFRLKHRTSYCALDSVLNELVSKMLLSRISIVTLFLENKNCYRIHESTVSDKI